MLYPKIGIRPVIDGRWGGVRESLENQTVTMANNAAKLISGTLRYPDGKPVECVVGCTTIGGGAEAARVAEQFSTQNVVATLSVTPCWCYGTETFDMDPKTIKAVWGFNGTERPGAVYLAAVMAAHAQRGLPAFSIYGHDVQDASDTTIPADVAEKILRFARCAVAVGWMKNKAYVNLGGVAMGIAGSFCDAELFQKYFGMRAEWVDMTEIVRRITLGIYDAEEYERALAWVKANCREGFDCHYQVQGRARGQGLGVHHQDDDGDAGHPVRQPEAGRAGLARGSAGPQRGGRRLPGAAPVDRLAAQRGFFRGHPGRHFRLERPENAHALCNGERHLTR